MLRIIPQSNSAAAKSYYSKADYYVDGPESSGVWGGRGSEKLGLQGEVAWKDFAALCDNLHPQSGKPLTPRNREDRRVLYDFNFHVPKSVSLAFEINGDERILKAFQASVKETMREAETEMKVRVRAKGANEDRVSGNMVYATFIHRTSRPSKEDKLPDPHLHAHVTVFNASYDEIAHQWKAGQFGDLKKDAPYWQAQFQSRFARQLADLGYGITRRKGGFELSGVSAALAKKFSRRTSEIEALAAAKGITDPAEKDKLGALSRMAKSNLTMPHLQNYWQGRLTPADEVAMRHIKGQASKDVFSVGEAVTLALDHCLERESVVPERQFYTEALKAGLGSASLSELKNEARRQSMIETDWAGKPVISTRAVLQQEKEILSFARDGRGTKKPLAPDADLARDYLHADQARAVRHVWNSPDRVQIIRGAAGTGKTTLTREAFDGLRARQVRVVMLAPSAIASREVLKAEGFDAETVAKFLLSEPEQAKAKGGVIWVDEAGLLATKDMHKLFQIAAKQDARVVLMGDTKQFGSINRGPAMSLLESHAGLPSVQVTDIKRQSAEYKQVTTLLAKGHAAEAFAKLDQMHWVHELDDETRIKEVAVAYLDAKRKGSVVLISPTKKEGEVLTGAIRKLRKEKGELGEERRFQKLTSMDLTESQRKDRLSYEEGDVIQFHRSIKGHAAGSRLVFSESASAPLNQAGKFQAFRSGTIALAVGDDIRMTAAGKSLEGHRFNNGSTYRVKGFTKDGNITLSNDWVVSREFGHWSHDVVSTAVSSQGKTVDRVIISQTEASGRAANQAEFYVAVSRGKYEATIFTDSKAGLRDAIQRSNHRPLATEAFAPKKRPFGMDRHIELMRRWKHHLQFRSKGKSQSREKEPLALER